jgi:hypothetical protein
LQKSKNVFPSQLYCPHTTHCSRQIIACCKGEGGSPTIPFCESCKGISAKPNRNV